MGIVVTKNFKIKTGENSFSDPINFLSTSVYLPSGKNLDTHLEDVETALGGRIDDEIEDRKDADTALGNRINDEIKDRKNADTALGDRIDTLNTNLTNNVSTLTGLITAETKAREDEDKKINTNIQTLTDNLNTDISQINKDISTLKTTVEENTKNISSLEDFIIGENQIEENVSPLVDQVTTNTSAIEALKLVTGKDTLEEGASSLLEMITSLEARIAILEGKITFYIDDEKYQVEEGTTWFKFAAENGLNCASLEDYVWDEAYSVRVFDVEENNYVIGETVIIKDKNYTWLADQ